MTSSLEPAKVGVDRELIRKTASTWPRRATLRSDPCSLDGSEHRDPGRPDHPIERVPFREHPRFQRPSPEQRDAVLTWGCIACDERTITLEEHLANPAFTMIMHGAFPGATDIGLDARLDAPPPIPCRRLRDCQARASADRERAPIGLAFGVVAEVGAKGFLNRMARDEVIQPAHRRVALLHHVGVPGAQENIADTEADAGERSMVRDVSSVKRFIEEIGILDPLRDACPAEHLE